MAEARWRGWGEWRGMRGFVIVGGMAEAGGRRRTAGQSGNRSSTRSRLLRSERWRWRLRIRKSFMWERASTLFMPTATMEMEFTSPWMAERTGSTWDWGTRGTSGESWSIRGIRTSCWLRRWVTVQGRTKSEEFFARRTEGGAARKLRTTTMSRRRLIFVSNQGIREWCTGRCGTGFENRDKKVHLTVPGAGSTNQPMKA